MKILYVITKTETGGAQSHLFELLKHAKKKGWEVGVVSDAKKGWLYQKSKELGVVYFENRFFKNSFNPLIFLNSMMAIKRIVNSFNPNIVHVHSGMAGAITRVAIRNKIPTVFTAHGWSFTAGVPKLRGIIALCIEKLVSKYTSKIICVSKNDYNLALKKGVANVSKLTQIYNFVEIPEHTTNQETEKVTILFVGRLAPPKDLSILFKAYSKLSDQAKNNSNIVIVGNGSKEDFFKNEAKRVGVSNSVVWKKASHDYIGLEYVHSHVFVIPTHWEGFPMTILEAMSYGLPVLASSVGGVPEIVSSEVGFLVSENAQVAEFTIALEKYILDKQARVEAGHKARLLVQEKFSKQKGLEETFAVYTSV